MTEQQTPALEAGDEDVAETVAQPEEDQTSDDDQSEDDQSKDDQPEDGEESEVSPAKARRERRKAEVQRLRDEKKQAERENELLRKRLEQSGADLGPAPKREDFKDYDEWQAEMSAYSVMSKIGQRERAQIERDAEEREAALKALSDQEREVLNQQWVDQETEARSRYADYDAVARNPSLPITEAMVQVMGSSEIGPDIAYFLGSNPAEAARIAAMSPLDAARQIGLIEARVSLPKAQTQTSAPDPVSPVRPKAKASKDPAKMSMEEYRAARASGQLK